MTAEPTSPIALDDDRARRLDAFVHSTERLLIDNTRALKDLPVLPIAHVRVLKKLRARPGIPPAELAEQLQLARTTISEMTGKLVAAGLVERRPSATDGRSVVLYASQRALDVMADFDTGRAEVMARTLGSLSSRDRTQILNALPALERLRLSQDDLRTELARSGKQLPESDADHAPGQNHLSALLQVPASPEAFAG